MVDMHGRQGFKDRTNAIFAALDGGSSKWSLAEHQVFEAGRDANYSSDEDREADRRESEIPSNLFFDGIENDQGLRVMPSNSFCRALDAEPEMDANDAVAEGISYRKEKGPSHRMKVIDRGLSLPSLRETGEYPETLSRKSSDNLSRKSSSELSWKSSDEVLRRDSDDMDFDIPMPQSSPPRQEDSLQTDAAIRLRVSANHAIALPQIASVDRAMFDVSNLARRPERPSRRNSEGDERPKRRVTFGDTLDIPDTERNEPVRRHMSGTFTRSYVPDHVKNPHRYTEYVLETPIVVGSGMDGTPHTKKNRMIKAKAEEPRDAEKPDITFAEFRKGSEEVVEPIKFQPSKKIGKTPYKSGNPAAERINQTSLSIAEEDDFYKEDGANNNQIAGQPDKGFKNTSTGNRNFRSSRKSETG